MEIKDEYQVRIVRSRRKTLSVQIKDGILMVKVPLTMPEEEIREFLQRHERWIRTHMARADRSRREAEAAGRLSMEDIRALADRAMKEIPPKVRRYAALMGVTYGRITIRNQKTRWGSCSAQGNLNFNCLLMLCPDEVVDAVVVHELAHRLEMNHSERFYQQILRVYPDYPKWNRWLKENGPAVMRRMTGYS